MNRSFLPVLFLSFLVLLAGLATAQPAMPLTFRTLTAEQGLSENSVYSMAQDRRGFLWLGTQDGLNRYDGSTFKVFRNDPQQIGSLSSNFILALAVDAQGALWIGTGGGGLNRFDPVTGKFRVFKHQEGQPGTLTDDFVRTVFCDQAGTIWAGTEGGLHRYNPKTGRFQLFTQPGSTSTNPRINYIRAI
jgi:ligand-binding sensor domain-containing protein